VQEATLSFWIPMSNKTVRENFRCTIGIAGKKILFLHRDQKDLNGSSGCHCENGRRTLFGWHHFGISEARERAENKHRAMIIFRRGDNPAVNCGKTKVFWRKPMFGLCGNGGIVVELPEIFTAPKKKSG